MNGDLTGDYPELTFNFAPSKGEPFTMTRVEVADAMAFVRELKAKAEKKAARYTCPKCGGQWDGSKYTSNPIQHKCVSCYKLWTP